MMEQAEEAVPIEVEEDQGERVRRSLVMMDVNLPSIALPDGVHCRAFTGVALTTGWPKLTQCARRPGQS
jgi:hypothetical protein